MPPGDTAPGLNVVDAAPGVDDLAPDFVTAVCRPDDARAVLDTVQRLDPVDLAGLVAAVDDHQPMTLEVVVDVLAELGVPPPAIAAAVGVDVDDVRVLLGPRPAAPRPSLGDARVIDLSGGPTANLPAGPTSDPVPGAAGVGDEDTGDVGPAVASDPVPAPDAGIPDAETPHAGIPDAGIAAATGSSMTVEMSSEREPVTTVVRIGRDDVDEADGPDGHDADGTGGDGEVARQAASPATSAAADDPTARGRVLFAVVLFVLLVGGAVALAWLLGAF